jgi:hypothetical protein
MDIKKFFLIDWIEQDLLTMKYISTHDNYSDSMTKKLGKQLHYRYFDYIMGRIRPNYEQCKSCSMFVFVSAEIIPVWSPTT